MVLNLFWGGAKAQSYRPPLIAEQNYVLIPTSEKDKYDARMSMILQIISGSSLIH